MKMKVAKRIDLKLVESLQLELESEMQFDRVMEWEVDAHSVLV